MDWYSRNEFILGTEYVDADGEMCLRYAGVVPAGVAIQLPSITIGPLSKCDPCEPVLIFMLIQDGARVTFHSHTKADADIGYSFISLADGIPDPKCWAFAPARTTL
jgi:hypothetical protein